MIGFDATRWPYGGTHGTTTYAPTSGTGTYFIDNTSNVFYEPYRPIVEYVNLFDRRYWDQGVLNRFTAKSCKVTSRCIGTKRLFTQRWSPRSRNSRPLRRKIRAWELSSHK